MYARYIKYFFYLLVVFACMPLIILTHLLGFYTIEKFCIDIVFRNDTVRKLMHSIMAKETGNFTSPLFKNYNNVLGMNVPLKPQNKFYWTGSPGGTSSEGGKSKYWSSISAIYDSYLYLDKRLDILTLFNVIAKGEGTEGYKLQHMFSTLCNFGFTTIPMTDYWAGLKPILEKWKKTYLLAIIFLPSSLLLGYLVVKMYIKKRRKQK